MGRRLTDDDGVGNPAVGVVVVFAVGVAVVDEADGVDARLEAGVFLLVFDGADVVEVIGARHFDTIPAAVLDSAGHFDLERAGGRVVAAHVLAVGLGHHKLLRLGDEHIVAAFVLRSGVVVDRAGGRHLIGVDHVDHVPARSQSGQVERRLAADFAHHDALVVGAGDGVGDGASADVDVNHAVGVAVARQDVGAHYACHQLLVGLGDVDDLRFDFTAVLVGHLHLVVAGLEGGHVGLVEAECGAVGQAGPLVVIVAVATGYRYGYLAGGGSLRHHVDHLADGDGQGLVGLRHNQIARRHLTAVVVDDGQVIGAGIEVVGHAGIGERGVGARPVVGVVGAGLGAARHAHADAAGVVAIAEHVGDGHGAYLEQRIGSLDLVGLGGFAAVEVIGDGHGVVALSQCGLRGRVADERCRRTAPAVGVAARAAADVEHNRAGAFAIALDVGHHFVDHQIILTANHNRGFGNASVRSAVGCDAAVGHGQAVGAGRQARLACGGLGISAAVGGGPLIAVGCHAARDADCYAAVHLTLAGLVVRDGGYLHRRRELVGLGQPALAASGRLVGDGDGVDAVVHGRQACGGHLVAQARCVDGLARPHVGQLAAVAAGVGAPSAPDVLNTELAVEAGGAVNVLGHHEVERYFGGLLHLGRLAGHAAVGVGDVDGVGTLLQTADGAGGGVVAPLVGVGRHAAAHRGRNRAVGVAVAGDVGRVEHDAYLGRFGDGELALDAARAVAHHHLIGAGAQVGHAGRRCRPCVVAVLGPCVGVGPRAALDADVDGPLVAAVAVDVHHFDVVLDERQFRLKVDGRGHRAVVGVSEGERVGAAARDVAEGVFEILLARVRVGHQHRRAGVERQCRQRAAYHVAIAARAAVDSGLDGVVVVAVGHRVVQLYAHLGVGLFYFEGLAYRAAVGVVGQHQSVGARCKAGEL